MIYPKNFEQKIGFDRILSLLKEACICSLGQSHVDKIRFSSRIKEVCEKLKETAEFKRILMLEAAFPCHDYLDLRDELKRIAIEGSFIGLEKLWELLLSYQTLQRIVNYIEKLNDTDYPYLKKQNAEIPLDEHLPEEIRRILNERGEIRDKASENLADIRQKIRRKQNESQKYIRRYLGEAKQQGWVNEDAETTVRNERMVIPMMAVHKRKIKGFIHDISSTGQTVFIEPEEIFNLNNEIMDLLNDERLEIIRILKDFTNLLRPQIPALQKAYSYMGWIDFVRAKAKLALQLSAGIPVVHEHPLLQWKDAKHPLLFLTLERLHKSVVPLDLYLEKDERILIISGPNAGGKSVCLKTVGLLQYMMQCGLAVSMSEQSEMGIFETIFVDIGDEQSIENDLSTYSSHLRNMRILLENANDKTLFLTDELGSGTEPQVGGAIAEAVLEDLDQKKAYGIVTTHYTNLKLLAQRLTSVVNGAMLFDNKELKPLYILKKGSPGSSFAFEMAKNMGLPENILDLAIQKTGHQHLDFEAQLQQLEVDKRQIELVKKQWSIADDLLAETLEKYNKLSDELNRDKKEILNKAKDEAKDIVKKANAIIEKTIREIKEKQAEKTATQRLRQAMMEEIDKKTYKKMGEKTTAKSQNLKSLSQMQIEAHEKFEKTAQIKVGDLVRLQGQKEVAEVIEIKGKSAVLALNMLRLKVPIDQLEKLDGGSPKPENTKKIGGISSILHNINEQKEHFSFRIDIRGISATEADEKVQKLLDDAILFGEKHLEILHGKGNGILRRLCREILQNNPAVQSFRDQNLELGGSGVTIIEMK